MSANKERAYWGTARLSDGDTVLDGERSASRRDPYRRGYAVVGGVLAFGVLVSAVVLAAAVSR